MTDTKRMESQALGEDQPKTWMRLDCYWRNNSSSFEESGPTPVSRTVLDPKCDPKCKDAVYGYRVNRNRIRYYVCKAHWDMLNNVFDDTEAVNSDT